ncbi:hypothetical protein DPMN_153974 [Dreissena polymorpha]|uniref:Uncharacterized protein n=1 Tax=Dreissena polymorpha TaxID=45954 RepID=A0A9D4FLR4_DREPO|nr:hypothetical protein DPMN_153974 [Dreissena polymorpha]
MVNGIDIRYSFLYLTFKNKVGRYVASSCVGTCYKVVVADRGDVTECGFSLEGAIISQSCTLFRMFYQPQFLFCLKYGFPRKIVRINFARDSVPQCLVGDTIFPRRLAQRRSMFLYIIVSL